MNRHAIGGFAVALLLTGGCATSPQVTLDHTEPSPSTPGVVYVPPATAPAPAGTTTTIVTPGSSVVQVPATPGTTVIPAPPSTSAIVPAPGTTTVIPPAGTTTIVPGPGVAASVPLPVTVPQMLRVDEIDSQQVRANTIYANRIEAGEIRGVIHQDRSLTVGDTHGEIKGRDVVASVIYADEIKAHSVVADRIFVREIRRR